MIDDVLLASTTRRVYAAAQRLEQARQVLGDLRESDARQFVWDARKLLEDAANSCEALYEERN